MNEQQARAVTLVQAFEAAPEGPLWTVDDRRWATRAAQQSLPEGAGHAAFVAERARLALQRLAPRDAGVRRVLAGTGRTSTVLLAALVLGAVLGLVSDTLVAGPYFNLLSPLFWGLLAWNLVVYVAMVVMALRRSPPGPLRRGLVRMLRRGSGALGRRGPLADFAARWTSLSMPLQAQRGAVALHLLAAGMALGLVAGLMLRGLVFDYRAGWASTLLQPEVVRQVLAIALAPAHAVTGIAAPDAATFDALRVTPTQPATASAASWLQLMSVQLLLLIVVPRTLFAAWAWARVARIAARFPLPLDGPYFERLRPGPAASGLWVLPHAEAPGPPAVLGLRALLAQVWGEATTLQIAPPLAYGEEAAAPAPPGGCRTVVLVDLTATPEPDVQGRLLQAVDAARVAAHAPGPVLLLADSTAYRRRFGDDGAREQARIAGWRELAQAHGAAFLAWPLEGGDVDAGATALRAAFDLVA
ncbi:MAG: DUF2868 domain-containing protein [Rubrivivax sp.]